MISCAIVLQILPDMGCGMSATRGRAGACHECGAGVSSLQRLSRKGHSSRHHRTSMQQVPGFVSCRGWKKHRLMSQRDPSDLSEIRERRRETVRSERYTLAALASMMTHLPHKMWADMKTHQACGWKPKVWSQMLIEMILERILQCCVPHTPYWSQE